MKNNVFIIIENLTQRAMPPLFIVFCAIILLLSIRGLPGTPTAKELNTPKWIDYGPLELSPERGRYALTYSIVEEKSFFFSPDIAQFVTPDLGYKNGHFVSLFAPAVSFIAIPGYILGKMFGAAQVGAFAVIALFGLLNALLIRATSMRLGAKNFAATLGGSLFLFATPAFAYAGTLYQHHISTFLLLLSVYTLVRWKNMWSLILIWFLAALSISVDYPNAIFMTPVCIYAFGRIFGLQIYNQAVKFNFKISGIFTFVGIILPLAFFLWFNYQSYGNPFQLSGTIPSIKSFKQTANHTVEPLDTSKHKKAAVGFFYSRNLLNGLQTHFLSQDRGVIYYTPIMLLGIFGMFFLYKKNKPITSLLLAIIGVNILLYSMWGDPWGGWAFGSRYLIPTYAMVAISTPFMIKLLQQKKLLILFCIIVAYSVAVNALGAVTSSQNPPQIEAQALEKKSFREEKYTYERNYDFLKVQGSKSFAYKAFFNNYISAIQYYLILLIIIIGFDIMLAILARNQAKYEHSL